MPDPVSHHTLISDNALSGISILTALVASTLGSLTGVIHDNLPFILQLLSAICALTMIARNLVALWIRKP